MAMEKIPYKWRFIAGKIIYKWAMASMAMLNHQRVINPTFNNLHPTGPSPLAPQESNHRGGCLDVPCALLLNWLCGPEDRRQPRGSLRSHRGNGERMVWWWWWRTMTTMMMMIMKTDDDNDDDDDDDDNDDERWRRRPRPRRRWWW